VKSIIKDVYVLGIIGIAKNAGKTTTLNYIIDQLKDETIGLTSIGLDGEDLDQVNFLPKPKIRVRPHMIVATAKSCLENTNVSYDVLEETEINTAIGKVMMIRILKAGNLVIAGPTTNHELHLLLLKMKKYVRRILVDGAFNRMTFANIKSLEGIILSSGASYHLSMEKTIKQTKWIVESFNLKQSETFQEVPKDHLMIETKHQIFRYTDKNIEKFSDRLSQDDPIITIFIKGAVTSKMVAFIISKGISDFKLIVEDPTKLLISHQEYEFMRMRSIEIEVIHQAKLLCVTINPFSTMGHHYDKEVFKNELQKVIDVPIYNVKDME
jgi:hypothetical protein